MFDELMGIFQPSARHTQEERQRVAAGDIITSGDGSIDLETGHVTLTPDTSPDTAAPTPPDSSFPEDA